MPPVKQEGGMAEVGVFLGSHCGPAWKSEGHGPMVTPTDGSPMPEIPDVHRNIPDPGSPGTMNK